jgi:hypothetical protein
MPPSQHRDFHEIDSVPRSIGGPLRVELQPLGTLNGSGRNRNDFSSVFEAPCHYADAARHRAGGTRGRASRHRSAIDDKPSFGCPGAIELFRKANPTRPWGYAAGPGQKGNRRQHGDTDCESDADADRNTHADTDADRNTRADTDADGNSTADTDADGNSTADTDADGNSAADTDANPNSTADTDADSGANANSDTPAIDRLAGG